MARGKAKLDSKLKNMKRTEAKKRAGSELNAHAKAAALVCKVCMTKIFNITNLKEHYASRHPKSTFKESDYQ